MRRIWLNESGKGKEGIMIKDIDLRNSIISLENKGY